MGGADFLAPLLILGGLFLLGLGLLSFWFVWVRRPLVLGRVAQNPIMSPNPTQWWESAAVFNPAAFVDEGRVHLLYRALGHDGVSRIGYAESADGIHFKRHLTPAYDHGAGFNPPARLRYTILTYNTDRHASGGGWGGTEDPRAVTIDGHLYMTLGVFEGWQSIRMALTSLPLEELRAKKWRWKKPLLISPLGETHKNWVLFPEKINGKFAILHALTPTIMIEYVERLEDLHENPIRSNNNRGGRAGAWDAFVRGAAAPPLRTDAGWLLLYHGMNPAEPGVGYKVGAMLLDARNPQKVLFRSDAPVLEPKEWYENDWKPNVVYASGAVVFNGDLLVYYGGGDKHIAVARANLHDFVRKLTSLEHAVLEPVLYTT